MMRITIENLVVMRESLVLYVSHDAKAEEINQVPLTAARLAVPTDTRYLLSTIVRSW